MLEVLQTSVLQTLKHPELIYLLKGIAGALPTYGTTNGQAQHMQHILEAMAAERRPHAGSSNGQRRAVLLLF